MALGEKEDMLKEAGFSETDIKKIKKGKCPTGWQVHHKLPIDDSGTNAHDNLVLIQNHPYHKVLTNFQNDLIKDMKPGEIQEVEYPIPNGSVYPPQIK